jgi:pimeloyl-ACP methyl ester carboxylesterase
LGDGAFVWNHVAPVLAARTAVAAVELRGHGDSPHDPHARYEPDAYAEDVIEEMKLRSWRDPVILVGHSLGATVAIHVMHRARERVRRLVLVDGGPGLNADALLHIQQQFLTQSWFHDSVDSFAAQLQLRHPLSDPKLLRDIAAHAMRPLPAGGCELKCDRQLVNAERASEDCLVWEKMSAFDRPILVMRGAGSAVLSRTTAERMAYDLPDCRVDTVPGAGHAVMLDNPGHFLLTLQSFLAR